MNDTATAGAAIIALTLLFVAAVVGVQIYRRRRQIAQQAENAAVEGAAIALHAGQKAGQALTGFAERVRARAAQRARE